jgi:hypothetical protein
MNVVVKVQGRHTITKVILANAQLIDGDLQVVLAVDKYGELDGVGVLLKGLLVLHLVAVDFA